MKRKSRFFATALATAMCATSILGLVACSKDAGELMDDLGDLGSIGGTQDVGGSGGTENVGGGSGNGGTTNTGVYTVTLNANGGSFVSGVKTSLTTTNGKITEALPTASQVNRDGYTFAGWYTAAEGGSAVSITTFTVSSNGTTLYVHWDPNSQGGQTTEDIVITFNANGGTLNGAATATAVDGQVSKPSDPAPPAPGDEFLGWGRDTMVNPDQVIDFTSETFTRSETLYAQWGQGHGGGTGAITFNYTYSAALVFDSGETIVISFNATLPLWADSTTPMIHMWSSAGDVGDFNLDQQTHNVSANLSDVTFMIAFFQTENDGTKWKKTDNQTGSSFVDGNEYVYAPLDTTFTENWVYGEDGVFTYELNSSPISRAAA